MLIVAAKPDDIVPEGAVFMDFHFMKANPNILLGTSLDPVSKTPDYKVCAVRMEKLAQNSVATNILHSTSQTEQH